MENRILGLHHVTAIAGNAQRNMDFYTRVLGLRLVKKTVNFDDPGTYHFYFGDEKGAPGTILTFFPWEGIRNGVTGTGMVSTVNYSVAPGSFEFWKERFDKFNIKYQEVIEKFGEKVLSFRDPDGLSIHFVEDSNDKRKGWHTNEVNEANAAKGFYSVTLLLQKAEPTINVLSGIFGYQVQKQEGNHYRLRTNAIDTASVIDITAASGATRGINAAGTFHHVAFRVKNEESLMEYREKVIKAGLHATDKIDRDYFFSVYFREPGGVLFELATDPPGFTRDEPLDELGTHLKLPRQYEPSRKEIEAVLPVLT
ncbi:MAG TPA: ring-cleaving dioxygenase [Chitinophagaceae bacterium]|nr:ring-cleaving dioxygenase [Chitinophagaceae bacterium]